ncbi:MAG: hypothetical protein ACK446_12670 [Rhodobacterales bacterium]
MKTLLIATLCMLAAPALAETSVLSIGNDRFEAGKSVRFEGPAVTDLFMAGNRVEVAGPVQDTAHLAGRRISVDSDVGGDLFAAGYSVTIGGTVGGDASVAGFDVSLATVTGSLRAAGADISVGDVGGYALVSGADVTLNGAVAGDAVLVADELQFGPDARVAGALTIYASDPASVSVPESVAPASRVKIDLMKNYQDPDWQRVMPVRPSFRGLAGGFLMGVLISGLIAALVIGLAPKAAQSWRELALAHPGRAIWSGFLVTSALAGSGFVLMLTIIGVFLLPVMLMITVVAIFAGYALGSYVLGVGVWLATGRLMPDHLPGKFGLACLGAFLAGLAWLIPVAGWFFVLGLTLLGIGTLAAFVVPPNLLLRRETVQP